MQFLKLMRLAADPKHIEIARRWADALTSLFGNSSVAEEKDELVDPFPILTDVVLERAYFIAAYILGDVEAAKKVVLEVASDLEVPNQLRKEIPASESGKQHQYKATDPAFVLDELIYKRTLVQERLQENKNPGQLDPETMAIRFVKSIMEYTIVYQSLNMTVGLYRILNNYPVQDVQRVYQIVPAPDDKKPTSDYIRHLKKRLFEKLLRRYKNFVEEDKSGDQTERRFVKRPDSSDSYPLIRQALNVMAPTLSACPLLPERLENPDSLQASLYPLSTFEGNEDKNQLERIRKHMLTHHSCFARLLAHLGIASPEQFLEIPLFNKIGQNGGSSGPRQFDRQNIPPLSADDKKKISAELGKRKRRFKKMKPEKVVVAIDNVERATLSLDKSRPTYIEVEEGAGIVEFKVSDKEGDLPVGILPMRWDDSITADEPTTYRLPMNGGEVKFMVTYASDIDGMLTGAKVVCSYVKVRQPFSIQKPVVRVWGWLGQLQNYISSLSPAYRRSLAASGILMLGALSYLAVKQGVDDYACEIKPSSMTTPIADWTDPPQLAVAHTTASAGRGAEPVADSSGPAQPNAWQQARDQPKPFIRESVTIRADDNLLRRYAEPPRTTLSGMDKSETIVGGHHSVLHILPEGMKVITLPVTDRNFVKFTELARAGNSPNIDPSPLLTAKRFYVKPFAANAHSQDMYTHLVNALKEDNYTISTDRSKADAILEGKLTENATGVTLKLLLNSNNTDGNVIWLKSVSLQNKEGDSARTAAELSEKAVKSLQGERKDDVYVALDFYLAQAARLSSAPKMPLTVGTDTLQGRLGGHVTVQTVIDGFLNQAKADKRINKKLADVDLLELSPHIARMFSAATGSSSRYTGPNLKALIGEVKISEKEFGFLLEDLAVTFDRFNVAEKQKREVLTIVESFKAQIVSNVATDAPVGLE